MHFAMRNDHYTAVRTLLDAGADPSIKDIDGKSVIEYAIEKDQKEILQRIIKVKQYR